MAFKNAEASLVLRTELHKSNLGWYEDLTHGTLQATWPLVIHLLELRLSVVIITYMFPKAPFPL